MPSKLTTAVQSFAEEVLYLGRDLAAAEAIQWTAAPVPKPRDDTTQRATGGHGDPTLDIVLDARRLAVRDAVEQAHAAIAEAQKTAATARQKVNAAIATWEGK